MHLCMNHNLNSLKGVIKGTMRGTTIGVIKGILGFEIIAKMSQGNTRIRDYSQNVFYLGFRVREFVVQRLACTGLDFRVCGLRRV